MYQDKNDNNPQKRANETMEWNGNYFEWKRKIAMKGWGGKTSSGIFEDFGNVFLSIHILNARF